MTASGQATPTVRVAVPDGFRWPAGFQWGVATAAYQIEGAVTEDGRGPSSWDAFCAEPGRVDRGESGAVACDHYHRSAEDIALMADLGVDAYRFSFAWSRILPTGRGAVNHAGLDFYDRLVDELLAAGITPTPTLFHWDTPLALEEQGGWMNRDTTDRFAEYAHVVGSHFADRVPRWITTNEALVLSTLGYGAGTHAPGQTHGLGALLAAHHLLLGHGKAVGALRESGATEVGITNNHPPVWVMGETDEDRKAADFYDQLSNRFFADSVLLGRYPEAILPLLPESVDADLQVISAPIDFYGINYYNPSGVAAPDGGGVGEVDGRQVDQDVPFRFVEIESPERTDFDWPVIPDAFRDLLIDFKQRYGDALPPIMITENGCAINDGPDSAGRVVDDRRISYTASHLAALAEAIDAGVDIRGYFHWSLLDNFEWAAGYRPRFGLVHVDFDTLARTPKDSYHWYQQLISASRS
ncbi:MAG: GH1 family beta-glucosidase [Propionibacteriaceae bacterium]